MATLFETVVLIKDGEEGQIVDDTVFFDASKQQFPRMITEGESQRVDGIEKGSVAGESSANGFEELKDAIFVDHTAVRDVKYAIVGVSAERTEEMVQGERFSKSMGAVNVSQAFLRLDKRLQVSEDLTLNYWQEVILFEIRKARGEANISGNGEVDVIANCWILQLLFQDWIIKGGQKCL